MMDMIKGVSEMQSAAIGAQIGAAVTTKVLNTTADLQKDLLDQLLGKSGIGQNLNVVA
ncbi:MAG: hypothetical protein LBU26_05395 [Synergistaceae bacterium]|jgi:hypothetical protein|nr:hypothetical protein [Synergistaceae bacterium]